MGNIKLGLNLEFSRHHNWSFFQAVDEAARIAAMSTWSMVHLGR